MQLHRLDRRAGLLVGRAEALVGRGAGEQGLLVQPPGDAAEAGRDLGQLVRGDQSQLEQQGGGAHDVLDVVQAQELGRQLQLAAAGQAQLEAGGLADLHVLGEIARVGLQPVPDHFAALGHPVQRRMGVGADQLAARGDHADQLGEGRLVGVQRREDVQVVVHQRRDHHMAGVVELELRAPVVRAHDVFVALDQEGRIGPRRAGGLKVQRDGADEIARVLAGVDQEAGAHGGQGRFAEAAGDDDGLAAPGMAAEVLGEAETRRAPPDQLVQLGVGSQRQLGARAHDGHVHVRRHQLGVEAVVVGQALALQIG